MRNQSIKGLSSKLARALSDFSLWAPGRVFAGFEAKRCSEAERALRIEEKLSLGSKKTLYLVHCKGHDILIAAGADTIASVVELSNFADSDRSRSLLRLQKQAGLP